MMREESYCEHNMTFQGNMFFSPITTHQNQELPTSLVVDYTDHKASLICEKLKNEETFTEAAGILVSWFERGECTKLNASKFYGMIQSTRHLLLKLHRDEAESTEYQLNEAQKNKTLDNLIQYYVEVEKICTAASLQKCWDQFTEAQRKHIAMWKKHIEDLKKLEEMEMESSDDEIETNTDIEQLKKFEEDINSLRNKLQAAKNEIIALESTHKKELINRNNQIRDMQQALQYLKREELNLKLKCSNDGDNEPPSEVNAHLGTSSNSILEKDARLIAMISIFLNACPMGANIDYISSFLCQKDPNIQSRDVENFMKNYPMLYREVSAGIGADLRKKWYFIGNNQM